MKKPFVSYTLYSFDHGCTIVYENGVFATVANEENLNHNKEHVTNELIKRGFVNGCSFRYGKESQSTNTSGRLDFSHFNENYGWWIYIDGKTVYHDGNYATIINPMQAKLEEAKLKYPIGTEFNCVVTNFKCKVVKGIAISDNYPNDLKAMADSGNQVGVIYDGATDTWATIIQEPIIINGKEVEFKRSGWVDINDMWFSKSELTALQSLNPIFTEILKRMEEKNNGSGNQ